MKSLHKLLEIPIRLIDMPPSAARGAEDRYAMEMLKKSIAAVGLLQPITVYREANGRYTLVSGSRRLCACEELGQTQIECFAVSDSAAGLKLRALIDAVQQRQPNLFEQAEAIADFQARTKMENRELAVVLGISELELSELLRLLELDKQHRDILISARADRAQILKIIALPRLQRQEAVKYVVAADKNRKTGLSANKPEIRYSGDIRLFLNSLNRIVASMQQAGYLSTAIQKETKNYYEYTVKISKSMQMQLPEIAGK